MKNILKSITAIIIMLTIVTATVPASAATTESKYINLHDFAVALAKEIGLTSIDDLKAIEIITEDEFCNPGDNFATVLTRENAALLVGRADAYLYKKNLDINLEVFVAENRISDINNVDGYKRVDVARAFVNGYIKGYSDGTYSVTRTLKPKNKISKTGALNMIKMLHNKLLRAKMSPDGQVIRTTKLPKYAKYYPYILASFPNEYYDWKFYFEENNKWTTYDENFVGTSYTDKYGVDYAYPKDMATFDISNDFKLSYAAGQLNDWVKEVKDHLAMVYNINYKTINKDKWVQQMIDCTPQYKHSEDTWREKLSAYVDAMEANKTIVECKSIDIDGSSLYYHKGLYYLKAHIKYRVVSATTAADNNWDVIENHSHNKILWNNGFVDMYKIKLNQWRDGYYDIALADYRLYGNGNMLSYSNGKIDDAYYTDWQVR